MNKIFTIFLVCLCIANANRILFENTKTSDKWQFTLFSSAVEQNTQSIILSTQNLLLIQNLVDEQGLRQIKFAIHQKDGTQIGAGKIYSNEKIEYIRAQALELDNQNLVFSWIQIAETGYSLYIQLFDKKLNEISNQIQIGLIHKEVSWDLVSEFYQIKQINDDQLLIIFRDQSKEKSWTGHFYNIKNSQQSSQFTLDNSNNLQIAINSINTIVILQKIQNSMSDLSLVITKVHQNGFVLMTRTLYKMGSINEIQYLPQLVALSNNNFVVLFQQNNQIVYYVYDQHFNSLLFNSRQKYQTQQPVMTLDQNDAPIWEYNNYFHGGQVQLTSLKGSLVITGINYDNLRFQLVQLDNDYLEFVQFREIHYEDLNIYKFNTQRLDDYSVFVSWIDGQPQTMLPEFVQSLYLSSLNLKLTLTNCDTNCQLCQEDGTCKQCNDGYQINNNSCILSCIQNCSQCSTDSTCDVCNSGFNLNNQLQCVDKNSSNILELQASISETTYKFNQKFRVLNNKNILSLYQEQLGSDFYLQLRLIDTLGNVINSLQLSTNNIIDYDFIVQSAEQAYLYSLEINEGYYGIKQAKFNPVTLEFQTASRLQIQNQGFTYTQNIKDSLIALQFENTVGFIVQGLDFSQNIFMSVYIYTYDGQFINSQYIGYIQNLNFNFDFKYFDYQIDNQYLYIFINKNCDHYLLTLDQNGNRISDSYSSQFTGYTWCNLIGGNPSLQKIQNTNKFMIAIEQWQSIFVFLWQDTSIIYQTKNDINTRKPTLIAYSEQKFSLIYEKFDYDKRFNTLEYIVFNGDSVQYQQTINQRSFWPSELQIWNDNYEYLIFSWLGYKDINSNQIYLQQFSLIDQQLLGVGKQCPTNCQVCDQDKNCQQCKSNYQLQSNNVCQLICSNGCSKCSENACLICQSGYQLNKSYQCEIYKSNLISIIQQDTNQLQLIDLDTNSNGNILISWMNIDPSTNNKQTYIKQIDQNGNQVGDDFKVNQCTSTASKVYSRSSFNVISTICGNIEQGVNVDLHFYDTNFNFRFQFWAFGTVRMFQYSIQDTPYDILFISDREFIMVLQYMNSFSDGIKTYHDNSFYVNNDRSYYIQSKFNNLKLSQDQTYIYTEFYVTQILDDGSTQIINRKLTFDYNCDLQKDESFVNQKQQYYKLSNSNQIKIQSSQQNIEVFITSNNKQLHYEQILISDQVEVQNVDGTVSEVGFYLSWIEKDQNTASNQLKAQGFFNNGTQITDIVSLNQNSIQPNNLQIQSLQGNQLIVLWYDQSQQGESIYLARYNMFLQITPLNTLLCLAHCDSCTQNNSCNNCSSGYHFNSQKEICELTCIDNCEICSQSQNCDVCYEGYYLINNQCIADNSKQEEVVLSDIKDSQKTRVSIANFNDYGFVVAWNDDYNGQQSIFLRFYDSQRLPIGDQNQRLSSESDQQYVKVESFDDDTFAISWFEGNCAESCRLVFQVLDRNGNAVIQEQTIALLKLPPLELQSPVVMKRKGKNMIIAYISYENNKTIGYYTNYGQDSIISTPNIIDPDNNVDNLEVFVYNEQNYCIYYVRNNQELFVLQWINNELFRQNSLYTSANQIKTPSAIARANGDIIVSWVETVLTNGNWMEEIGVFICTYSNECFWQRYLDSNQQELQKQTKLIGQYGFFDSLRYSIIYQTYDYLSPLRRKINLVSYYYYDWDRQSNQLNIMSYIIRYYDLKEFSNGEIILVSVGQLGDSSSKLLITKFDLLGNQQLLGNVFCQSNCGSCRNNQECISCKTGYTLNNGQCEKECDLNCKYCDPYWNQSGFQCYECDEGFQLNSQQQCQAIDNSISQQLINTYQTGNQYDQKVAVLQNQQSIIVWTSENQNQNGKSIYMQLYDQQFNKVGSETLVTKDNIGVQEQPDIIALQNNEFIIIWKDNNSSSGRRILMQRFNDKYERAGDAITVYDSSVDLYLNGENPITYLDSYHQIVSSQNGHLAVLILLKVSQNLYDIRLKQFNEKYQEYNSIAIGSTVQFDQCQLNALNNLLFVTWKSTQGIRIKTINDQGSIVNGELVSDSTQYSNPIISPVSEEDIILVYSKSNQLVIQKYDIQLQKVNNLLQVKSDFQITSIQVVNIDSGYVVVYKELKQTQYYSSDLIYFISFDSNGGKLSQSKVIVNNLYGNIRDLRLSAFSNGEVLISWTQLINYYLTDQIIRDRNLNDLSGDGIYIKRYNLSGNVQSIQNVVCQTYCKQCSKSNLCEACADGYQFDQYKLICQPICSSNCQSCSRYLGQYKSYCQQCQDGYTVNEKGDCSKIIQQDSLLFHSVGGGEWQIRQILTLENQSIVIIKQIYQDDAYFSVIDQSGNLIAKEIWLENSCCQKVIKASALATGGFVVVYRSFRYWDDQNMVLNVYDNIGTRIKQQVLQTFATWGYYYWWDYPYANRNLFQIKSLNGGGFILLYMTDNDGSRYHNPQMYFRIYNQEYSVVSNDVKLKTYFNNNYYWDWAPAGYYQQTNYENLNILENGNQIIISFGTSLYNGWDESKNYIQLFVYDKQGQFQSNKQVQVVNDQYYWWNNGYQPRFYLFQRSQDQYLLISFQNQKVFGFYLDTNFQQIIQKSIDQSYYWDPCYGCCYDCWNQNTIQIIVVKNTLIISSKSDPSRLQLQSFNYNLEPITNPKQIGISRQNSGLLWNHFIQLYNSEAVLITQIIDNYDLGQRNVVFNLFDNKINKAEWNQCDVNCINCLDSQKQCIDCKSGYYLNDQKQCKSYCVDSNCAQCDYSVTNIQKCSICNVGFELKDNSLCIAIDSSKIRETLLAVSQHDGQNTPRIKTFSNGEFLLITLHNQNEIYAQYYDQVGQKVGNEILLLSYPNINHFDFSISKQEDMIVVAWVSYNYQARFQRFNIDLSQVSDQVYIDQWFYDSTSQVTVQFLENKNIACLFYNDYMSWMSIHDENNNLISLRQIEFNQNIDGCYWWGCYWNCYWWGCGSWFCNPWGCWNYADYFNQYNYGDELNRMYDFWNVQSDVNQKYIDYFSYWYAREPSTVVTDNYIIVVAQHFDSIHAQTFDYNGNLLYQQYFRLFAPYQPSVTQLENGKIVIVWKDIIQNFNGNADNQSVPKQKQTILAYIITDEQFNNIRIQYIGMDYVQEERPDVTAISNGFAISFSGRSEITNANNDLRIAYFDLNGNIQTGFISVSSQSSQPINSNLAHLNDGSLIVSWYQNEEIYVQKIDRSGTIQKLINDIICPSNCKVCKLTNYCQICSDGYHIDDQHQCQENSQPQCQIGNCQICEDGSDRCQLCQNGYFLDENLNMCNQLDNQQNVEITVAKSNVFQDHSTQILQLNDGTIIHLWLQQNGDNFEIWGQTFTYDGSLSLDQRLIIQLAQEVQFKGTAKNSNILILIYNRKSTRVLEISQDLKIVNNNEIADLIAKSFTVSYEWYNSQIQLFDNGYLIQITGIKQQAINQMSNNPEIKRCRVTELFIFDMTGQQIVPEFTFWLNDQQSSGFLDQNNECKYQDIAHILYEDTQFYVLQQKNRDWNQIYLSIFDYNGQKLQEYWVSDWGAAYWDPAYWDLIISRDQINLIRLGNGELGIINKQGQGYIFDSNYCRYRDISINANTYFYNDYQVQSLQNEYNVFVETQSFGQTQRNKYYTFRSWDSGWIGKINFISQFTVYQGSFNVLKLQNGEILFNWMEQQNNDRQGSIIIVRMNIQGDIVKFPTFSCQDQYCSYCTNVSTCKSCAQNYYMDKNNKCQPQCSDNCSSCSYPFTCDICLEGMHVNDNQECIQTPSQLNPETSIPIKRSDEQDKPRVASFSDGSFVIVWQSLNQDGDGYGVYAQKFNSNLSKQGVEIRVNTKTFGAQQFPDITILDNDNIIIIWIDGDIENQATLYYQRFDKNLNKLGNEVVVSKVNIFYVNYYDTPCVVQSLGFNMFVIQWINNPNVVDNNLTEIFFAVFDKNGVVSKTNRFQSYQSNKEIVIASNGMNFISVFQQNCGLIGIIYSLDGTQEFQRDITATGGCGDSPAITVNYRGEYIVAYQSSSQVIFKIFDMVGNQISNDIFVEQLNTLADNPDIAALSNGDIIVTWSNKDNQGRSRKLRMQQFDQNGAQISVSKEVNLVTTYPELPQITVINNDQFVIVWQAYNVDTLIDSGKGIYLMMFTSDGIAVDILQTVCFDKCEECKSSTECTQCSIDYELIDQICVPKCSNNCLSCQASNLCDICEDGFVINNLGMCEPIGTDPLPSPLPNLPKDYPSYSGTSNFSLGVVIYSGSIISIQDLSYLQISLVFYTDTDYHNSTQQIAIDADWLNIYNSDIFVLEDQLIVYWTQQSFTQMQIQIHTIKFNQQLDLIQNDQTIDTFEFYSFESVNRKIYIYGIISQIYIVQSVYQTGGNYQTLIHSLSDQYNRNQDPTNLEYTQTQLYKKQIIISENTVIFYEFFSGQVTVFEYDQNFMQRIRNTIWLEQTGFVDQNSVTITKLPNQNAEIAWVQTSNYPLSAKTEIYFLLTDMNYYPISHQQNVLRSMNPINNLNILTTQGQVVIVWVEKSIFGDSLNADFYDQNGGFIESQEKINLVTNNIVILIPTYYQLDQIYLTWVSLVEDNYKYYIGIINSTGVSSLIKQVIVCKPECLTCGNEYTCNSCPDNYILNTVTNQCLIKCPNGCDTCTSTGECITCLTGYSKQGDATCIKNECTENCELCNQSKNCLKCKKGFLQDQQDFNVCYYNCAHCLNCADNTCYQCEESYWWVPETNQCELIDVALDWSSVEHPLRATFETGDYVLMWKQNEGIYIQLFRKNGKPVGKPTQVNKEDLINNNRRLLQESQDDNEMKLFADLAIIGNELVVLWVDQTLGDMKVKFKKYDHNQREVSDIITIAEQEKQDLSKIAAPCLIKTTTNNQFIIGWFKSMEEQVQNRATMLLQSFSSQLEPIGKLSTLLNTDLSKVPVISADKDGVISITYSSQGYTYLAQMSQEGIFISEPIELAHPGQAFKSTNLNNGNMVFLFEAQSTNISPPQFFLSYEIMNQNKEFGQAVQLTYSQFGEEHPDVTKLKDGFIITWRTINRSFKSQDIYFQVFDNLGNQLTSQIMVERQGLHPSNPRVQLLNEEDFIIAWTAINDSNTAQFYMEQFKLSKLLENENGEKQIDIICSDNCQICHQNHTCLTCNLGYYMENSICIIDCPLDCLQCTHPNQCDQCDLGYNLTWDDKCEPIICDLGYSLNEDNECIPICSNNCNQCQSPKICTQCQNGYILNEGLCKANILGSTDTNSKNQEISWYHIFAIVATLCLLTGLGFKAFKKRQTEKQKLPNSRVQDQSDTINSNQSLNRNSPIQFD